MKKCTIITSIYDTNNVIKKLSEFKNDLIIVGDLKSPLNYSVDCIYLDVEKQKLLFQNFSKLLSYNHYSRKNIGYLYAILNNYDMIYDTDDDNVPLFKNDINFKFDKVLNSNNLLINIYSQFTTEYIWSRGFPHSKINQQNEIVILENKKDASIVYGLCDGDTDVDAIYRLIYKKTDIEFEGTPLLIDNRNLIVFNSQSTFWLDRDIFLCLYLPTTVNSRFCDILRSYITQYILKSKSKNIGVYPHIAYQKRNEHNILDDLQDEIFMYRKLDELINILENVKIEEDLNNYFYNIYDSLLKKSIVEKNEISSIEFWLKTIVEGKSKNKI